MIGKKVKLRITFLLLSFVSLILIVYLIIKSLEENVVYFKSPTEIKNLKELTKKKVRVGGMVKKDSIKVNSDEINFDQILKFYKHHLHQKILPFWLNHCIDHLILHKQENHFLEIRLVCDEKLYWK